MLQKLPTNGFGAAPFGASRNDVVDHSFVAERDNSFQSSPCFCQFIRI